MNNQLDELTRTVIGVALQKMFNGGYFDICTVDKCLKLAGVIAPKREYDLLHALHCVHFRDMPPELARRVPDMITACFNGLPIAALLAAIEPPGKAAGPFTHLLSLMSTKQ